MPVCKTCGVDKEEKSFYRRKNGTLYRSCKVCRIDQVTCIRRGITRQELLTLEVRAGGKCECCGRGPRQGHGSRLAVDHDHHTNAIRGLLCGPCNLAIGLMEDDPIRLRLAADYLEGRSPPRSS